MNSMNYIVISLDLLECHFDNSGKWVPILLDLPTVGVPRHISAFAVLQKLLQKPE